MLFIVLNWTRIKVFMCRQTSIQHLSTNSGKKNSMHANRQIERKVLLISLFFPPEIGGGSTGAWNRAVVLTNIGFRVFVLAGYPQFRDNSNKASVYNRKPPLPIENMDDITVIRIKTVGMQYEGVLKRLIIFVTFALTAIFYLPRVLKITGKIDIVYARAPIIFSSIPGFIFSRVTKSFYIYEAPDLWPDELANINSPLLPILMRFGKLAAKLSYMGPDMIITIGQYAADRIVNQYRPKINVYAIPVGVDMRSFPNPTLKREKCRKEMIETGAFPEELDCKFIVLYSGLMSAAQQIDSLVFAAQKLMHDSEIVVILIGDGPDKDRLLQVKDQLSINNLYFLPVQPRYMMHKIISAVDVCTILLAPDPIFDIAVPTKFYEYLACSKPILGVCTGELADIINSNGVGTVTDAKDVNKIAADILKLKNSPSMLYEMQTRCVKAIEPFTLDSISSKLNFILRKEKAI